MHDIRAIRDNPAAFDAALARRGIKSATAELVDLAYMGLIDREELSEHHSVAELLLAVDEHRKEEIAAIEYFQSEKNRLSKELGQLRAKGKDYEFQQVQKLADVIKTEIRNCESRAKDGEKLLKEILARIPNIPADDVPPGADENDNVEVRTWGDKPAFDFTPKEHYDIMGVIPGMDFEVAAKTSGARFVMLKGSVARIHRALAQFMLDTHVDHNGLKEMNTPVLVRDEAMYGTDKLPKFGEDSYQTTNGWWLVPTSEVPLTYTVAGDVLEETDLPKRYAAHTLCFRSEAGSAGRDTSGMLRQHQFEKVEMVSIVHPDQSDDEQQRMLRCAEDILERLGIPYRTVLLCTGDMGFGARRTFDIEAWVPGQNTYREISSVSTTGDFQARRMNARFKPADGGKPQFVHTLNGSGLAVGRCLIAVLENGQHADGSVKLPDVLAPYLGGKTTLGADGKLA
ncbi:MAG: serine--tRNA ligase [Sulfitobacter sp.]